MVCHPGPDGAVSKDDIPADLLVFGRLVLCPMCVLRLLKQTVDGEADTRGFREQRAGSRKQGKATRVIAFMRGVEGTKKTEFCLLYAVSQCFFFGRTLAVNCCWWVEIGRNIFLIVVSL